jgi:hypothetical protein
MCVCCARAGATRCTLRRHFWCVRALAAAEPPAGADAGGDPLCQDCPSELSALHNMPCFKMITSKHTQPIMHPTFDCLGSCANTCCVHAHAAAEPPAGADAGGDSLCQDCPSKLSALTCLALECSRPATHSPLCTPHCAALVCAHSCVNTCCVHAHAAADPPASADAGGDSLCEDCPGKLPALHHMPCVELLAPSRTQPIVQPAFCCACLFRSLCPHLSRCQYL